MEEEGKAKETNNFDTKAFDTQVDIYEKELLDMLLSRKNVKYTNDEEYSQACN